jgi:CRP-like cAMP-binding protein
VSYDAAPTEVKAVVRAALAHEPLIDHSRDIEVLVSDFGGSAVLYRVRAWVTDFAADESLRDAMRTRIWYAFRRHQIEIPYPVQVQYERELPQPDVAAETARRAAIVRGAALFSALDAAAISELARVSKPLGYGAREIIVREGDGGDSMFLLSRGEARVTISKDGATDEVARLGAGAFFGEMSLLTGDPRTATVTAVTDCDLLELSADSFRQIVAANPVIVDVITEAMARRRAELGQHRASLSATASHAGPDPGIVGRIRAFLGLSSSF